MRTLPALALLLLLTGAGTAWSGDAAGGPGGAVRPGSLRALGQDLGRVRDSLTKVLATARCDEDEWFLDIYLAYAPKEMKSRKRKVRADDVLRIMTDPANAMALRARAREALKAGSLRGDVELSSTGRHGSMSERAWFCRQEVVDHLKDDDREARRLVNELLDAWYMVRGVAAITSYKVDDPKTWSRAIGAWKRELKKQ